VQENKKAPLSIVQGCLYQQIQIDEPCLVKKADPTRPTGRTAALVLAALWKRRLTEHSLMVFTITQMTILKSSNVDKIGHV